jgi:hypothetical protein
MAGKINKNKAEWTYSIHGRDEIALRILKGGHDKPNLAT